MTDILTDYAMKWLNKKREKPFCLFIWHKAIHQPFSPAPRHSQEYADNKLPKPANYHDDYSDKPDWLRRGAEYGVHNDPWRASEDKPIPKKCEPDEWYPKKQKFLDYLRAISAVDESIGKIYKTLQKTDVLDNTFFVFTSDNGYLLGEHHSHIDKRVMWEESIKVPLVIRYPKYIKSETKINEMVLNIDFAPTFIDLAEADIPETMQGLSFKRLLTGENTKWRESFFYEYFQEDYAPGIPSITGVRTDRYKLIKYPDIADEPGELYDLQKDPHELTNLIEKSQYKQIKGKLERELYRLKKKFDYQY